MAIEVSLTLKYHNLTTGSSPSLAPGLSGWEIVEQEKCKLVYAHFFDGVQCFDAAKGWLRLSTPEFQHNSYDVETKTFSTNNFSVRPVTPTDLDNLQSPLLTVSIAVEVTGLEVILTADQYKKTRIIPVYYLDSCDSYDWNTELEICISTYLNTAVTKITVLAGALFFVNNSIFKHISSEGSTKLYRLKNANKEIITFESDLIGTNVYYFPLAYYVEELPAAAERTIIHNYKYAKEYYSYDRALYPCHSTLGDDTEFDSVINSTFSSNISYIETTENEWEFNLVVFRPEYLFIGNRLSIDILFFNQDTGVYYSRNYWFDFYDKYDAAIDLETALEQENENYDEYIQNIGIANCAAYFKIYFQGEYQEDEDREVNRYNFPSCEDLKLYSLETCECDGGLGLCFGKFLYSCEECDDETGIVSETCEDDCHCTIFGCKCDTYDTACICAGTNYGIAQHPSVRAGMNGASCFSESYSSYRLTLDGYVQGKMAFTALNDNGGKRLPWISFFNIHDLVEPEAYVYDGVGKTISVRAFILLNYLNSTDLDTDINKELIPLTLEQINTFAPEASELSLDWFGNTSSSSGAYTSYGKPCKYIRVSTHVEREGYLHIKYLKKVGHGFIFPTYQNYSVITGAIEAQISYDDYCDKIKYLATDTSYTYGVYLNEKDSEEGIPKSGILTFD